MIIFEYNGHKYLQTEVDKRIGELYRSGVYYYMASLINEKTAHLRHEIQKEGGTFRIQIIKEGISIVSTELSDDLMEKIETAIVAHP